MDITVYLNFLAGNSLFSAGIILVSFISGWLLYNFLILRKTNLRDSLFEKDNLAAWIEFIGAFIFPVLYLAARAVAGSASENLFMDLLICMGYAVVYILIFTALRLVSNILVGLMSPPDQEGRIDLNKEIFNQKSVSASLFSVALSVIFVNIVRFLDFSGEFFVVSVLRSAGVLLFTLLAVAAYSFVLRYKTTLMKEIFVDNNVAAGAGFLGFVFAVEMVLGNVISAQKEFNFADLMVVSAISLVILGVISLIFRMAFSRIVRVDTWKEIFEQNNIGAALGECALYIGVAYVIVNYIA